MTTGTWDEPEGTRDPRAQTDLGLVVTRFGLSYHAPECRQLKSLRRLEPYRPGMTRTDPQTGATVLIKPCRICRPETRDAPATWNVGDEQFEHLMWVMLGASA